MKPDNYNLLYNFCVSEPIIPPDIYFKRLLNYITEFDIQVVAEIACLRAYGHNNFQGLEPRISDIRYLEFLENLEPSITLALCNSIVEQ